MAETKARDIADSKPSLVSDQSNTSTGYIDVPSGTTAQRPESPTSGNLRYNTEEDSLEFYTGTTWAKTNEPTPTITSISGTIYSGLAGKTLTISGTNFNTTNISIEWLDGNTRIELETNQTPTSSTSITRTIPSSVYGKASGTTIGIRVLNAGTVASNIDTSKSVVALPSGGTLDTTSVSGYRIHTFTTSGTFVNTVNNLSVEYLIIGGGASGSISQSWGVGGGGGGGYRTNVSGQSSGGGGSAEAAMTLSGVSSGTNYTVTVGGGGASQSNMGSDTFGTDGNDGTSSSFNSIQALGGGGAGHYDNGDGPGRNGGCGGGGTGGNNSTTGLGGSGTANQGYGGGGGRDGEYHYTAGGGGGGAGSVGQSAHDKAVGNIGGGGNGGTGVSSNINGTATHRAGGGGGSSNDLGGSTQGQGAHGGTNGANASTSNATQNSGGGSGGAYGSGVASGSGGDGLVIIRYQTP